MIGRGLDLCGHLLQELHLAAQARDLLPDLVNPRLRGVAGFAIGTIKRSKVALNATLDLFDPLGRLVLCVISIPVVHCFEFASVDCNGRLSKQA
jgi:hypothetical protein